MSWLQKKMSINNRLLRQIHLALLLILVSLVLGGWRSKPSPENIPSQVASATSEPTSLLAEGKLVPAQFVSLSVPKGNRVAEVFVREGQQVHAGDLLLRLDGYEQRAAEVAAAELEIIRARQALQSLHEFNPVKLAEVELSITEVKKELALAQDNYKSLSKPKSPAEIAQAYANLKLAENKLSITREDLEKAQKRFKNKKSLIWRFTNQRQFKLRLTLLEQEVAVLERRLMDAQQKYNDLLAPPDEIDLALAQTRLGQIQAHLNRLEQQRNDLLAGPDPDELQVAQARLNQAQARLAAAKMALEDVQVKTPMDGVLVELKAKAGEWLPGATPFAVIADLNKWNVEIEKLSEALVTKIRLDQPVSIEVYALPDLSLSGQVDSIDLLSREDDGDTYYDAQIHTDQSDTRLRWGMTVQIEFLEPEPSG